MRYRLVTDAAAIHPLRKPDLTGTGLEISFILVVFAVWVDQTNWYVLSLENNWYSVF